MIRPPSAWHPLGMSPPVRLALATLWLAVWSPAAVSRSQPSLGPVPYVFALTHTAPDELVAEEVMGPPRPGRYFVLDFTGLYAEVRVLRSRELRSSSVTGVEVPHQYELEFVRRASRPWQTDGHVVGVGPMRGAPTGARLMAWGLALAGTATGSVPLDHPGAPLPDGVGEEGIEYAVDLDRDRVADLVTVHRRSEGRRARASFRVEERRELWSRAAGSWARRAELAWTTEVIVGP